MTRFVPAIALLCSLAATSAAFAAGSFPRLLPPDDALNLTLTEEPNSTLPLNPSCMGEASLTLQCRAFKVVLQNTSAHTIHISGLSCAEPLIRFDLKEPNTSYGWMPVSRSIQSDCPTLKWTNLRLKPGERTEYTRRLTTPGREVDLELHPGAYILRAEWTLFGCTEAVEGADCLTQLQVIRSPGSVPDVDIQDPAILHSNNVTANSPPLPDFGPLKFSFDVKVIPNGTTKRVSGDGPPSQSLNQVSNIDSILFHYAIRNMSDRAVRNGSYSCSDSGIVPEYRTANEEWKQVPSQFWSCTMNIYTERKISPKGTLEGDFKLVALAPGYDTAVLHKAGDYRFRFTFWPHACIASPDASFCLSRPDKQPSTLSNEIDLRLQ